MLELMQYGAVLSPDAEKDEAPEHTTTGWSGSKSVAAIIGLLLVVGAVTVWTQRTQNNSVGRAEQFAGAQPMASSDATVNPGQSVVVLRITTASNPLSCLGTMIGANLILTDRSCVVLRKFGTNIYVNDKPATVKAVMTKSTLVGVFTIGDNNLLKNLGIKPAPPLIAEGFPVPWGKKADVYGVGLGIVDKAASIKGQYRLSKPSVDVTIPKPVQGRPVFYTIDGKTYLLGVTQKFDGIRFHVAFLSEPSVGANVRRMIKPAPAPAPKPSCTGPYDPVCGVNGQTYPRECVAKAVPVAVQCKGECPCAPSTTYNCPAGTFEVSRSASGCVCEKCPAGHECAGGPSSQPKGCAPGYYQPQTGQKSCRAASPGNKAPGPKATKETACAAGEYQSKAGQTTCHQCPTGNKCASPGTSTPVKCRVGYLQPKTGQTGCVPASPGNHVPTPGSPTETPCPAGTYTRLHGQGVCKDCPIGHECPGKGNDKPISCPIGSYQSKVKSQACDPCPAGNQCPHKGMTKPSECPVNMYQHCTGQPHCIPCKNGHVQPKKGQQTCVAAS